MQGVDALRLSTLRAWWMRDAYEPGGCAMLIHPTCYVFGQMDRGAYPPYIYPPYVSTFRRFDILGNK